MNNPPTIQFLTNQDPIILRITTGDSVIDYNPDGARQIAARLAKVERPSTAQKSVHALLRDFLKLSHQAKTEKKARKGTRK